jgi:hypothetical protein
MRDDRNVTETVRRMAPVVLVGVLLSWLVVQNGALLLMVSWPLMPAVMAIARALVKAGMVLALQLAPATLMACGVAMLWVAARRAAPEAGRRLGNASHV